jgi:two-component system, chemotaxis family, sensor kinase CheA
MPKGVEHTGEGAWEGAAAGRGKLARGRVVLTARRCERWVTLEIGDDGAGVDLEAIRVAARAGCPVRTHAQRLDALFAAERSTRTEVTETSGQGVGLSALREACLRLGGTLDVDPRPGVGTTLRVRVPL